VQRNLRLLLSKWVHTKDHEMYLERKKTNVLFGMKTEIVVWKNLVYGNSQQMLVSCYLRSRINASLATRSKQPTTASLDASHHVPITKHQPPPASIDASQHLPKSIDIKAPAAAQQTKTCRIAVIGTTMAGMFLYCSHTRFAEHTHTHTHTHSFHFVFLSDYR